MSANDRIAVRYSRTPVSTAVPALLVGEAVVAPGDLHARRQALHVPLPRPVGGLVEVVDVEDQVAFGGAEHAEVGQVRVTAELGGEPRGRRARQIARHDQRRAAVEGERRDPHAPVADRHELGHPAGGLLLEEVDRVEAHLGSELGVAFARNLVARRLPAGLPLRR